MGRIGSYLVVFVLAWIVCGCTAWGPQGIGRTPVAGSPALLIVRPQGTFLHSSPVTFAQQHDGSVLVRSNRAVPSRAPFLFPVSEQMSLDAEAALLDESIRPILFPSCEVPPASFPR